MPPIVLDTINAMINWKHSPKNTLVTQYVECYWFLEKKTKIPGYEHPKLNPDPTGHLILTPADQPYQYDINNPSASGKGSHWLFPHTQTYLMDHSHQFMLLGVKFHTGALYSLNINPHSCILNTVTGIDGKALLGSDAFNEDALLNTAQLEPEHCVDMLDDLLTPWLSKASQDKHSKLTESALALLLDTPIADMGTSLNCSQRTLERSFSRVTGLTLKQCQSMNRLEAMLEYLYLNSEADIDWLDIACQFGFSDQPHLIRYLKREIGETPGEYARLRDLTIDIYGGVDPV